MASVVVASTVDMGLDALLMATSEISSLVAQYIVAVVGDSTVLLNFRVRHCLQVRLQSLVRVTHFTEDVNGLKVSAAGAARVSVKERTAFTSLLGGTGVTSIHIFEVLEVFFSVLNVLLQHLG